MKVLHILRNSRTVKILIVSVCILFLLGLPLILRQPTNDRAWSVDQAILPTAAFQGDSVSIAHIRYFKYESENEYTPHYYNKSFNLSEIKRIWYVVEPFSPIAGPAHAFLSFEFDGDEFISISIEVRKQEGQAFEYLRSIYHGYELMYVVADERDVIKLRSNYRHDEVYLYPGNVTREESRKIFVDMLRRANTLATTPEFYNVFTNTCTTNIVHHINKVGSRPIPFSWKYLLPSYSDELALELGFLETDLNLKDAREKFHINALAEKYADDPEFSSRIRGR